MASSSTDGALAVVLLLSLFLSLPRETVSDLYRCPQINVGVMMAFREKCYRFVASDKTWNEAQLDCQSRGGNLVHIKNRETQDFILNAVKHNLGWKVNGMWIGAHDRIESNNFEWVNGDRQRKGEPLSWSNWASGQPSCGSLCVEFCGQMRLSDAGKWHDYRCASSLYTYHYCCMYDMIPKTTVPATTTTTAKTTKATTVVTTTVTRSINTSALVTEVEFTGSSTFESPSTEPSPSRTTTRKQFSPPDRSAVGSSPDTEDGDNFITVSVPELVGGLVGAVVLILLLLLLLLFVIRRRKQAHEGETKPNVHYTTDPYGDGVKQPTAYINPTFVDTNWPGDTEHPPAVSHYENEKVQNSEWNDSQNPYEEIPFDKEFQFEKPQAKPTSEYLHAIFVSRQDQGLDHGPGQSRDPYSKNSLCRGRTREEPSSTHPESELSHPAAEDLCKQLDGYVLPAQTAGHVPGISRWEYANNPGSKFPGKTIYTNDIFPQQDTDSGGTREQTSGDVSPLASEIPQIPSTRSPNALASPNLPSRATPSRMDTTSLFSSENNYWTPSHLEALSTDRSNHENVYHPVLETSV